MKLVRVGAYTINLDAVTCITRNQPDNVEKWKCTIHFAGPSRTGSIAEDPALVVLMGANSKAFLDYIDKLSEKI
jgi:hypothetical protein